MFHNMICIYIYVICIYNIYHIDFRCVTLFQWVQVDFFFTYSFPSLLSASSIFYYLAPGLHGAFEIPNYR